MNPALLWQLLSILGAAGTAGFAATSAAPYFSLTKGEKAQFDLAKRGVDAQREATAMLHRQMAVRDAREASERSVNRNLAYNYMRERDAASAQSEFLNQIGGVLQGAQGRPEASYYAAQQDTPRLTPRDVMTLLQSSSGNGNPFSNLGLP